MILQVMFFGGLVGKLLNNNAIKSCDYGPPLVYASIGQKWEGGLYVGSLHFCVMTITERRMPCGRMISILSLAFVVGKTRGKQDSKA